MSTQTLPIECNDNDASRLLPSNAIAAVTFQGMDNGGKLQLLTFKRAPTMRNPRILLPPDYLVTTGLAPPPRPSVPLPPPGDLFLDIRIGAQLGRGSSGSVFEASLIPGGSSTQLTSSPPVLPPLVVKISFRGKANKLAREAYYYDMCRPLQGASIPRYYGHFRAELPPNMSPVQFNVDGSVGDVINLKRHSRDVYTWAHAEDQDADGNDDAEAELSESPSPPPEVEPPDSEIEEIEQGRNTVSILVLERLGGYIAIEPGVSFTDDFLRDIYALFADLAHMHVYPDDIRYQNILHAPASPPGFPGKVCAIHQRVHEWRLVDLEHAAETNATLDLHHRWCKSWLRPILDNLPRGFFMNKEDIF